MKLSVYGIALALKNLGIWLSQYTVAGISTDKPAFLYALIIYICVSVPSDLLLLNHIASKIAEEK